MLFKVFLQMLKIAIFAKTNKYNYEKKVYVLCKKRIFVARKKQKNIIQLFKYHKPMKKNYLFFVLSLMIFCGQINIFANSDSIVYRTPNDIKKLLSLPRSKSSSNKLAPPSDAENLFSKGKEFSICKDMKAEQRNEIEFMLTEQYEDVIISEVAPCAYFIIEGNKIGVCDLKGNLIVPPIEGYIAVNSTGDPFMRIGNTTPWSEQLYIMRWGASNKKLWGRWKAGSFKAVYNRYNLDPVIPFGEYDDIGWAVKGVFYYYVMKYDESVEKWGALDIEGKIVVPCEYKALLFDKNKIYGSNKENMEDIFELAYEEIDKAKSKYERNQLRLERTMLRQEKLQKIAETLQQIGETSLKLGGVVQSVNDIRKSGGGSFSEGGGSLQIQYSNWERRAQKNYQSLTNTGYSTKQNGKDRKGSNGESLNGGNYVQQKRCLREAQNQMKRIREQALKKGISIPQSHWETVTVSY